MTPRFSLVQCIASTDGLCIGWLWIIETYLTSDGPRTRTFPLPRGTTLEQGHEHLKSLLAKVTNKEQQDVP